MVNILLPYLLSQLIVNKTKLIRQGYYLIYNMMVKISEKIFEEIHSLTLIIY